MTRAFLVTAGDGPVECNQAVGHVLDRMADEAGVRGLTLSIQSTAGRHGPKSAVVVVHGPQAEAFQRAWVGTIRWRMQSRIRANQKRANWFIGVFPLGNVIRSACRIDVKDVAFSTLRAGGPGGQHQNTTDSAVRAVHHPTGLCVVVRDGRSQHQNKSLALERLQSLADAELAADRERTKAAQNQLHHRLERGNPVRRFKGPQFKEER